MAFAGALPLLGSFSVIGRASAGAYYADSIGRFRSDFKVSTFEHRGHVTDSDRRMSYRLGAEVGLRYALTSATWASITGSVSHLSDVPTGRLPADQNEQAGLADL